MASRRYEILGAHRASGEPIRVTIEAESSEEARRDAIGEGILVSRVNELAALPASGEDRSGRYEPDESDEPMSTIRLGSAQVPDLDLLAGETVRAEVLARGWQIGLGGVLFGHRRRLVLTNKRLIALDRQLLSASVDSARLDRLTSARVGTQTNATLRVVGYLTAISGLLWLAWSIMATVRSAGSLGGALGGQLGGQVSQLVQSARASEQVVAASSVVVGLVMIYASRQRVIGAFAHSVLCGIRVRRLDPRQSRTFINALEQAIESADADQNDAC